MVHSFLSVSNQRPSAYTPMRKSDPPHLLSRCFTLLYCSIDHSDYRAKEFVINTPWISLHAVDRVGV